MSIEAFISHTVGRRLQTVKRCAVIKIIFEVLNKKKTEKHGCYLRIRLPETEKAENGFMDFICIFSMFSRCIP